MVKQYILIFIICVYSTSINSQVGINTTSPDPSAILDISSTTQGFLPPRLNTEQRNSITNPAEGLTIFNIDTSCLEWWNGKKWYNGCGDTQYSDEAFFCNGIPTLVKDVINPTTGKIWMDRNLGASKSAWSSTDTAAYGDLYQWGRETDGHQCRISTLLSTQALTEKPRHNSFIITNAADWLAPPNSNLWQGVDGVNNPCPQGYRLPTQAEFNNEISSWSSLNSTGAYTSPLKLTMGGYRNLFNEGNVVNSGIDGRYWTSTTNGDFASCNLEFTNSTAVVRTTGSRKRGMSVRCIKN